VGNVGLMGDWAKDQARVPCNMELDASAAAYRVSRRPLLGSAAA